MDKLFPYQEDAINWLKAKRCALLALDMGLGKSAVAIRGLDAIKANTAIVICPSIARINWQREFSKWATVERKIFICVKLSDIPPADAEIIICSYDYAAHNYIKLKEKLPRVKALLIDESHFLKEHEAKRTKAVMGKDGLSRHADRLWLLTGTPMPNNPSELWVMLFTFGVTDLSYNAFIKKFCVLRKTTFGLKVVSAKKESIPELRGMLSKIMHRKTKEDVMIQLPPLKFGTVYVEPGEFDLSAQASFIQYFVPNDKTKELKEKLAKEEDVFCTVFDGGRNSYTKFGDMLTMLESLSHSVSTLRRYTGLQKVEPAVELIKSEFESGAYKKLVIFAIHRDVINELRLRLSEYNPLTLFGQMDPKKKQKHIDKFQKLDKYKVMICNIQAAGTAITLTAASQVLFVEQAWVPGDNAQAIMRCHRIGQKSTVNVRYLILNNSIDDKVSDILRKKTRDLTDIFL